MKTPLTVLAVATLLVSVCSPALAETVTWTNTTDGLWADPLNWSPTQVPGASDAAVIDAGGSFTVTVRGAVSVDSLVLGGAGATPSLRIEGHNSVGSAVLTVADGFTNEGTIELVSSSQNYSATLNVTTGALVNASGATLAARAGAGGSSRTLGAELDNRGALLVEHPLTINKDGAAHVNSGAITLSGADFTLTQSGASPSFSSSGTVNLSNQTWNVSGGALNYQGGTINGPGALSLSSTTLALTPDLSAATFDLVMSSSTVDGPGRLINGQALTLRQCTVNAALVNEGDVWVHDSTSVNGALSVAPAGTLRVEGNSSVGSAVLTVADGFTNEGTIELVSSSQNYSATLNVTTGALVNAPGATLAARAGAGGNRTLGAELDNRGILLVEHPLTINKAGAAHANSGAITLSGAGLTLTQSGTAASFTNGGGINISQGSTLRIQGGEFVNAQTGLVHGAGTLDVSSPSLAFVNNGAIAPGASAGVLNISGDLPQGSTGVVDIELGGLALGSEYDQLAVSGTAVLDGILRATLISNFVPLQGDSFEVMRYGTRTGTFETVTLPLTNLLSWAVQDTETNITLTVANTAPRFSVVELQTVEEETEFSLTVAAVDGDIPAQTLTYGLLEAPPEMDIEPASGALTWTPGEADGPGTNTVSVQVTDDGAGMLAATNTFLLVVEEVNEPPILDAVADRTVHAEGTVTLTLAAGDPDEPTNTLSFALVEGPAGANVQSETGQFSWRPTQAEIGTTNQVRASVHDDGTPSLSATNSFRLIVGEMLQILSVEVDEQRQRLVTWSAIPATTYHLQAAPSPDALQWTDVAGEVVTDDTTASKEDTEAVPDSHRCYRVLSP